MQEIGEPGPPPFDATATDDRDCLIRQQVRARILDTAAVLFLAQGYRRTRMTQIARQAGIPVQELQAAVGPKADVLRAVVHRAVLGCDEATADVPAMPWVARLVSGHDAERQLDILVSESVRLMERSSPFWRVLADAARHDPGLRADVRAHREGRVRDQRHLVALIDGLQVSSQRAFDIVYGFLSPGVWHSFVNECGWTREEFRGVIRDVLGHLLVAPGSRSRSR